MNIVKRGFVPTDEIEFNEKNLKILKTAQKDICTLINRGYSIDKTTEFVGNHFMLSSRQRLALKRAIAPDNDIISRANRLINKLPDKSVVNIDGLNLIITLEVVLSNSTVIKCMDKTIRDLAGLRGTYRIIDKTPLALKLISNKFNSMNISKAVFYLDSPVSNTGRLKTTILELSKDWNFEVEVNLVYNADVILEKLDNVITTDGIILNKCNSWLNTAYEIANERIDNFRYIDLSI